MKFCSMCGTRLGDEDLFCSRCGARQEAAGSNPGSEAPFVKEVNSDAASGNAAGSDASFGNAANSDAAFGNAANKDAATGNAAWNGQGYGNNDMPPKNNNALIAVVLGISGAAVLLAAVLLVLSLAGSPDKPIKDISRAFNRQSDDAEDYLNAMPKFYKDIYRDALELAEDINMGSEEDYKDRFEDSIEGLYDDAEYYYGKNVKLSYKVKDKEKMDKDELEEIEEAYAYVEEIIDKYSLADEETYKEISYGFINDEQSEEIAEFAEGVKKSLHKVKVTQGYILTLDTKIQGKDDEDEEDLEICVVKMNGKWCIEPIATYSNYMGGLSFGDVVDKLIDEISGKLPF